MEPEVGNRVFRIERYIRDVVPETGERRRSWDEGICGVAGVVRQKGSELRACPPIPALPEDLDLAARVLLFVPKLHSDWGSSQAVI